MRIEEGWGVVLHQRLILVVVLHLAACGGGFSDPALDTDATADDDVDAGVRTDQDAAVPVDSDSDGIVDAIDNCPQVANSGQLDGDVDGYGDDCDCDAADAAVAAELVLSDSLDADRALIAPATGFPTASWLHQTQSYRQLRLDDDAADAAAFAFGPLTNVRVDVTTASTNTESFGGDDLRQLFVFARGASNNAAVSALACGVEIDESLNDIRQTSIIELSGSPLAPASTVKAQTARDRLDEDEEFSITLDLKGQTMTCTVVIDGQTTAATTTQALGAAGTVGFYTRETEAAFKNVRVCSYRDE